MTPEIFNQNSEIFIKVDKPFRKYTFKFEYSETDNAWIVSVPELPGCMMDGETLEVALNNVKIVIEDHVLIMEQIESERQDAISKFIVP